jgi:hypothetical protein
MTTSYELKVRGRLSRTVLDQFALLALAADVEPVETVLHGPVEDQAALHGLIRRIEALGLELVEVRRLPDAPRPEAPSGAPEAYPPPGAAGPATERALP